MKTAVLLYEPEHAERLSALPPVLSGEERTVIAVGADVEFALEERGIAFRSARGFRSNDTQKQLVYIRTAVDTLVQDPRLSFFAHRGFNLGKLYAPALKFALAPFLYSLDILARALEEEAYDRLITFTTSVPIHAVAGVLERFFWEAPADAARLACAQKKIAFILKRMPLQKRDAGFALKRNLFGLAVGMLNALVTAMVSQKRIRILASENWKNIGSLMHALPEGELFLLDRMESLKAGWRAILRNRMRFVHPGASLRMRRLARAEGKRYRAEWDALEKEGTIFSEMSFRGYALRPHLALALGRVVSEGGKRAVVSIEETFALVARVRPNVVLVRAGVSAQTHFAILCAVAKELGIPSLEIQHGLFYFGDESLTKGRAAAYVAEYGPKAREGLKTDGYDDAHLFDVGSPRFDVFRDAGEKENALGPDFHIVCIAPDVTPGFFSDSYEVYDYFETVRRAAEGVPGAFVTVKLRAEHRYRMFFERAIGRAFENLPHRIADRESMREVLAKADVVVSCYSTAILEAMLARRSLVLIGMTPMFSVVLAEFKDAEEREALAVARTGEETARAFKKLIVPEERARLVQNAAEFLRERYSFEGNASQRLANALRKLSPLK